jgi:ASC-1-like (ASCH) protein
MIKKYNNFKIINEKISFEEFCSKTQDIKKIIIEQNKDIIQTSQQMMYDILDIIGHIPGFF